MTAIGQAAGGEGQGQGQGGEAAQNGQQQGQDLGQLTQQIGAIGGGLEEMRQFLQTNPWAQQQGDEQGQQGDEIDLSFLDAGFGQVDQFGNPVDNSQALSQKLNEVINGAVDQRTQALMQPVIEKQEAARRNGEARDLAGEFPELSTPEMAQKIAGPGGLAEQVAQQIAQAAGNPQLAAILAAEPSVWRLAYMAHKAGDLANQGSGDPGAAHLEGGGGPGPAQLTEADLVKQIAQSGDGLGARVLNGM